MSARGTRCAVYTRKSHVEGLDQEFNSLDAQRQAGIDYINSQKHEGWRCVRSRYDDGGYSGGTMQRPALQRLFKDIEAGLIDVVVVCKVDRLSRSLGDFAQMMKQFDDYQVSFVSVTQQFNTTSSMGRLTLNMLLSFAQFEREIAGERIRDKIRATKKQGMWAGGQPPLGYRLPRANEERRLQMVPKEAALVRKVFARYLATHSPLDVARELNERGHRTKRWRSTGGHWRGGHPLTSKYIHRILANVFYIGRVGYTEAGRIKSSQGLHDAIIDERTWKQAQEVASTQTMIPDIDGFCPICSREKSARAKASQ